ncbi:hypothetical protein [Streptosporangium sp. NPDC023615]|uniref:hypothetical protein n=1 Tax=Streptosporangium sp. NPDC023615 TaxID=3154794 RepID=UPI00341CD71D
MSVPPMYGSAAVESARKLRDALARYEIAADVSEGHELALLSLRSGLLVWSNGLRFWWCSGWNEERRRAVYASQEVSNVDRAARRISLLCTGNQNVPPSAGELS